MINLRETCKQYFYRRVVREGWHILERNYPMVLIESPDGGVKRWVNLTGDIETLRPNAAGDECSIESEVGAVCPNHYQNVDEAVADDDTTYIEDSSGNYHRDLYNLPASSGSGTINFIKVYFRCTHNYGTDYAKPSIKSDSTVTDGTEVEIGSGWNTYSQQWNTNPADGQPWQWADIDALQIGVSLKAYSTTPECTQVYVEVDYTPAPAGWTGKISGVTDPAKVMGVDVANIAKVKGVA